MNDPWTRQRGSRWYGSGASKGAPSRSDDRGTADAAWSAMSSLIAGMLIYGGLGWLVGHWLGNEAPFVAGGILIGIALALYSVFARLGALSSEPPTQQRDRS